jgi:hypothetical protein
LGGKLHLQRIETKELRGRRLKSTRESFGQRSKDYRSKRPTKSGNIQPNKKKTKSEYEQSRKLSLHDTYTISDEQNADQNDGEYSPPRHGVSEVDIGA